jgi:flagellar hook protein FlgE
MPSDALNIAANALATYQEQIGVISNNIANVGTTGFKDQTLLLQDSFYNPLKSSTAPTTSNGGTDPIQEGDGVQISSLQTDQTQGAFQTTGIVTNLAIDGNGYFIMNNVDGTGTTHYTRDGNFVINQNGVLINAATGLAVQGYQASTDGTITPDGSVTSLHIPIGQLTAAVGTGFGGKTGPVAGDDVFDMQESGNLDQTNWTTAANGGAAVPQSTTTTIYDSLGGSHELNLTYTPVANTALPTVDNSAGKPVQAATEWQVTGSFTDGTQIGGAASATIGYLYFDANGQYINSSADGTGGTTSHVAGTTPSTTDGNVMNITSWGTNVNATAPTATTSGTAKLGAIGIDYSGVSSLAGTGQAINTESQNGYAQGQLTTIQIGTDGTIIGAFSNGLQRNLAQVSIATFQNPQALVNSGQNTYIPSANSGLAQIGTGGVGEAGTITSDSLEESNVSIATEFSKLIVAQNAYIANSKSITIGNQDLQTIDQLIQ